MPKKTKLGFIEEASTLLHPVEPKLMGIIKDQTLLPAIVDILSRQHQHHVLLKTTSSVLYNNYFLELFASHLQGDYMPDSLRKSQWHHIDIKQLLLQYSSEHIYEEFSRWTNEQALNEHSTIISLETTSLTPALISLISKHDKFRLIILNPGDDRYDLSAFSKIKLTEPGSNDALAILKTHRENLESYHEVIIPDEAINYAYALAAAYLPGNQSTLDKTITLVDSGAARTKTLEKSIEDNSHKAILTNATLASIVSSITHIPLNYLQQPKFRANELSQHLSKFIFGQEAAINLLAQALQYAKVKLNSRKGPLCSFLFAGPANVGKRQTAISIAEHLFGHHKALLTVNIHRRQSPLCLSELMVSSGNDETYSGTLLNALTDMPYAVLLLENVNHAPTGTLELFHDVLTKGYVVEEGIKYDFSQCVFIMTTTLGTEKLISLSQAPTTDFHHNTDLMQLVMNDHSHDTLTATHLSPQELCQEILPALEAYFSNRLLSHLNVIPFNILDYASIEKIIQTQLKSLINHLETQYSIELSFAPEVMRFLVQEAAWRGESKSLDKLLEQHLYSNIASELVGIESDKSKSRKMLLQLNDAGQVIKASLQAHHESHFKI